ncbi:putative ribonuclease H-like domain-containing protein [Tanacetum coccineum]
MNDVKARILLLMAFPMNVNLTFSQYTDAKTMFSAIETRFGGNEATKKTQKTLLKQQYENFSATSTESLDSIFNRLQNIVSRLVILGVVIAQEDLIKFLFRLPIEERNTMFPQVSTASFSDNVVYAFMIKNPNGSNIIQQDLEQIHEDDLEAMDLKWQLSLLSECFKLSIDGTLCQGSVSTKETRIGQFRNQDNTTKDGNNEDTSSTAMLAIDSVSFDWSYMAEEQVQTNMALMAFSDSENEVLFSEEVAVLKREVACKDYEINVLKSEFEKVKQEKEGIEFKIEKFDKASKDLDKLLGNDSKENSDDSLVKEQVSKDTSSFVESPLNLDKETIFLVDKKIKFVKPKNHEKLVKKSVRYVKIAMRHYLIERPRAGNTARSYTEPVNVVRARRVNAIKTSSCWVWRPTKPNGASLAFKRHNYIDARGRSNGCSRHMTVNIPYLSDFKEFDKGYVTFRGGAHGGRVSDASYFDSPSKDVGNGEPKSTVDDQNQVVDDHNENDEKDNPKDMFKIGSSHTLETTHVEFFSDEDKPEVDLENILNSYTTRRMTKPTSEQGFLNAIYKEKSHDTLNTCLYACFLSQIEPTSYAKALSDSSWVEAMQEELLQLNSNRLVAQGHRQEKGIDYEEVFAHVARIEAIRLFLAYASFMGFLVYQMDVKSAFLYGTIEEEVYVTQPPGFKDPDNPNKVYKVVKALYGLHQVPKAWYETLANYLLGNRFKRGKIDQTLFIKKQKGDILLIQVYVDDIIFGSTNKELSEGRWSIISQDKYVNEILKKFNYTNVKSASTPVDLEKPLVKDGDANNVDACGIHDSLFELVAYTDSDYAGATQDRKSKTGGCQFLRNRLISWQCKKQNVVATSITKAEYVAAASCCGQVLWIQNQLLDYGYNFMNTVLNIDNNSTICIIENHVQHSKTKHIEIRHHLIRDCNAKKLIQMVKIHTDHNVADLPTKGFDAGSQKEVGTLRYLSLVVPLKKIGDEVVHKELGDIMERAATIASSLEAEQESGKINKTQSMATLNGSSP